VHEAPGPKGVPLFSCPVGKRDHIIRRLRLAGPQLINGDLSCPVLESLEENIDARRKTRGDRAPVWGFRGPKTVAWAPGTGGTKGSKPTDESPSINTRPFPGVLLILLYSHVSSGLSAEIRINHKYDRSTHQNGISKRTAAAPKDDR
jgi:hypothetical protein